MPQRINSTCSSDRSCPRFFVTKYQKPLPLTDIMDCDPVFIAFHFIALAVILCSVLIRMICANGVPIIVKRDGDIFISETLDPVLLSFLKIVKIVYFLN